MGAHSSTSPIVLRAFLSGTLEAETLTQDLTVYRYWGNLVNETGSPWFSTIATYSANDARALLALPEANSAAHVSKFIIKARTTILKGNAASMVGLQDFGSYAVGVLGKFISQLLIMQL